jgi:hypothetical protein
MLNAVISTRYETDLICNIINDFKKLQYEFERLKYKDLTKVVIKKYMQQKKLPDDLRRFDT